MGFWQVPLSAELAPLATFITPFGRYHFKRLPFGISSAPEYFQKKMSEVLEGVSGVACMMDDILVFGSTKEEHDRRLHRVLQAIRAAFLEMPPPSNVPEVRRFLGLVNQ